MFTPTCHYFRAQKNTALLDQMNQITSPVINPLSPQFTFSIDTDSPGHTIYLIFEKSVLSNQKKLPKTPHNTPEQEFKLGQISILYGHLDLVPPLNLNDE